MEAREQFSLVDVYLAALPHGPRQRLLEERGVHSVDKLTDVKRNELYQVLFQNSRG